MKYFDALRQEALERVKLVSRIELGKLFVIMTVLGFVIGKGVPESETGGMVAVFGLLPFSIVLFDFYIAYNHSMIHRIGQYIRDHIEKKLAFDDVKLWEEYVSGSNQKIWDTLGRGVHLLMTLVVMVISGIFFNAAIRKWAGDGSWWIAAYILLYTVLLLLDFLALRIHKKWREYYT